MTSSICLRRARVAAELDVHAAAGHVRGYGHGAGPAGLGDDLAFALGVFLAFKIVVRYALAFQELRQELILLDRDRADRGPAGPLSWSSLTLRAMALNLPVSVRKIWSLLVFAHAGHVRRHAIDVQAVDFVEFLAGGGGRAGHAGELRIHAEEILESDGGVGARFLLDGHAFLGFDGLMQAFGPAPAGLETAGEFVHDDDFIVLTTYSLSL